MDKALSSDRHYTDFFTDIKERIRRSQYDALKAVNKELIKLYWDIGRMIVEKQQDLGWGRMKNSNHWLEKSVGQKIL